MFRCLQCHVINPFLLGAGFYSFVVALYLSGFSSLYVYTSSFMFYLLAFLLSLVSLFGFGAIINSRRVEQVYEKYRFLLLTRGNTIALKRLAWGMFLLGVASAVFIYLRVGVTMFQENKVSRLTLGSGGVVHYLGYLKDLLMYQMAVSYYILRSGAVSRRRWIYYASIILSAVVLSLNLNRGAFSFFLLFVLINEYLIAKSKARYMLFLIFVGSAALWVFAFVGDLRTEFVMRTAYHTTLPEFFGMPNYPSWFVWPYIYLTSPLENFREMLESQEVERHSFGLLAFYPLFQIVFKIFGESLASYSGQLVPYLDSSVGLNVSTFLQAAYIDFGYLGPQIYLLIYFLVLHLSIRMAMRNVFGLFSLVMGINILFWGAFTNSLAIGPFVIGWVVFSLISFFSRPDLKFEKIQ